VRLSILAVLALSATPALAGRITLTDEALQLTRASLLVDGHNDLPWALRSANDMDLTRYDLNRVQSTFHTDIPRLRQGGVGAQFWSVYVPSSTADDGTAYRKTVEQIDLVYRLVSKYPDTFAIARSAADVQRIRAEGKIASMIGMEGGHAIENSLAKLQELYDRGARYMTLTHSKNTPWADACTDTPQHDGLTNFGREVVRKMNEIGMLFTISHVSPATMKDALETSSAPVIFSHSSAYAITPHVRNVPDDVLRMLPANGGVVMVNFYTEFIRRGDAPVDVDTILDHVDHIAQTAGVDHVGIGSDFDGVPTLPDQMTDVSMYPYLTQGLLNRGYTHAQIRKILGENALRVFTMVEKEAARLQRR